MVTTTDGKQALKEYTLKIEQEKLETERAKLELERSKAKWTVASIFVPLLIAALSLAYNTVSQIQQAHNDFELKAAEIVLSTEGPTGALNKARALVALFPGRLSNDFAQSFDPKLYMGIKTAEGKMQLLTLISEHPEQKQEIIHMWKQLFPADDWIENLEEKQ